MCFHKNKRKRKTETDSGDGKKSKTSKDDLPTNDIPHNIVFIQKLPTDCTAEMVIEIFQNCSGYKGVRMVPGNRGMAFLDFSNEYYAGEAIKNLNKTKIGGNSIFLTYAKK